MVPVRCRRSRVGGVRIASKRDEVATPAVWLSNCAAVRGAASVGLPRVRWEFAKVKVLCDERLTMLAA